MQHVTPGPDSADPDGTAVVAAVPAAIPPPATPTVSPAQTKPDVLPAPLAVLQRWIAYLLPQVPFAEAGGSKAA